MPVQDLAAPPKTLLLLEGRLGLELAGLALSYNRLLRELPRGHGQAVMVVPGFGMSDRTIAPLLGLLRRLGYTARGWGCARNLGMRGDVKNRLAARLRELHAQQGPVTLVGWSLGGVFVREMARHQPQLVRRVITLGSPINGHPNANNMVALFRLANRGQPQKVDLEGFARRIVPPPVPCTAIYTRSDGIVTWRASLEDAAPNTENVEVRGSHFGLPFNPQVIRLIVERLARPD
ncbi:alpha/beta fold hydrolase [Solimonas soli]|uniref:alpha/beta fold hydrolase n=1 Tax=Solimonas soli TaxID=413479 RepID=UPI000483EAAA|nr:alpha/beta hydrolase [Solimonas soli]